MLEDKPKPMMFNLWSMITRSGANKKSPDAVPPPSPSINITSPGKSAYDDRPSVHLDGPNGTPPPPPISPPTEPTSSALIEGAQDGAESSEQPTTAYSSSDKYFNPAWNVGAFGINPKPAATEETPSTSSSDAPPPPSPPPTAISTNLSYHPSLAPAPIHFPPLPSATLASRTPQTDALGNRLPSAAQRLPRLVLDPKSSNAKKKHYFTTDLNQRWRQLSLEYKYIHHKKVGDQFSGRTIEFAPGGVGKALSRFSSLIVRSNMRVEERRKQRFEANPLKNWRLRRERHMRRFAVAMRRNVQIVHGLRMRGQSPVK